MLIIFLWGFVDKIFFLCFMCLFIIFNRELYLNFCGFWFWRVNGFEMGLDLFVKFLLWFLVGLIWVNWWMVFFMCSFLIVESESWYVEIFCCFVIVLVDNKNIGFFFFGSNCFLKDIKGWLILDIIWFFFIIYRVLIFNL